MTDMARKRTKYMLEHPTDWPLEARLPLVKRNHNFEDENFGFVTRAAPTLVVIGNVLDPTIPKTAKILEYESVDALLDDDWIVD